MADTDDCWFPDKAPPGRKAAVDRLVGERLRLCRKILGWTLEDLASALGHDAARLQDYESGRYRVPPADLAGIARMLQIPVIWFFVGLSSGKAGAPVAGDGRLDAALPGEEDVSEQQLTLLAADLNRITDPSVRIMLIDMARNLARHFN
jgi:transcriptional regulator with XRE-family HTH domain